MAIKCPLEFSLALTPQSEETKTQLESQIAAHDAERDRVESESRELELVTPDDWTHTHATKAAKIKSRKMELVRSEVVIRRAVDGYLTRVLTADAVAGHNAASAAFEAAKADVTKKLISIGYATPVDSLVLALHPQVKAARIAEAAIDTTSVREVRAINAGLLQRAEATLAELRRRDLAA